MFKHVFALLAFVFATDAYADVHCRFDPTGAPSTYLRWSPKKKMIWTQTGWPEVWNTYKNVSLNREKNVHTLVVFGDVPIISFKYTGNGTLWFDMREVRYPYVAHFSPKFPGPGAPKRQAKQGVCWTDENQPVRIDNH